MGLKARQSPWKTYSSLLAPYARAEDAKRGDLGPTPLRFVNPRAPSSAADLDPHGRDLVVAAGKNYDGRDLPLDARLSMPVRPRTKGS